MRLLKREEGMGIEIVSLGLQGTYELRPKMIADKRGYFSEIYSRRECKSAGLSTQWVQENQAMSKQRNTLRGLHFQAPPMAQAKLVRVLHGRIFDVLVDIRRGSETYGHWESIVLDAESCNAVYVPHGFAHGYCTLSEDVVVQYKVDNYYSPSDEGGLPWDDPRIGIEWPTEEPLLSERDRVFRSFEEFNSPFS